MRAPIIATVASVLSVLAAAQQPVRQTFRTGIDVVQVDVSVLDRSRLPVQGLTAADFVILEDGKPRPIVAFAPVTLPERPTHTSTAAWMRDVTPDVVTNDVPREGRLVVIMFDWSIRFEDQQVARRIAAAAVDQLGPGDLAAVVFTSAFANAGARGADYQLDLPLDRLEPGEHLLTVEAAQGTLTARRGLRFTVQ